MRIAWCSCGRAWDCSPLVAEFHARMHTPAMIRCWRQGHVVRAAREVVPAIRAAAEFLAAKWAAEGRGTGPGDANNQRREEPT